MKDQNTFKLSDDAQAQLAHDLKQYVGDEFEVDLTSLQTELLIDFLNQKVGYHYYNLGILAAMQAMKDKTEDLVMLIKEM